MRPQSRREGPAFDAERLALLLAADVDDVPRLLLALEDAALVEPSDG